MPAGITRKAIGAVLASSAVWGMLLGAVTAGLGVAPERDGRAGAPPLSASYARLPGYAFTPLDPTFIARTLGFGPGDTPPVPMKGAQTEIGTGGSVVDGPLFPIDHPPLNDRRADAFTISSIPFTARTRTAGTSRDPDEPDSCSAVGNTVWYRYISTRDEPIVASTLGSSYATALGVFRVTSSGLDMLGCHPHARGNSYVTFGARTRERYLFQIAGPAGDGQLVFHLERAARTTELRGGRTVATETAISPDGRYVAFRSDELILRHQIWLLDRRSGREEIVSVSATGAQAKGEAKQPAISSNGRFVAFTSKASNLVPEDTNDEWDVFVRDRLLRRTVRVSVTSSGEQGVVAPATGQALTWPPRVAMSADGRFVAFSSFFTNLSGRDMGAPCDSELSHGEQVFVHDLSRRTTEQVSVSSTGVPANACSSLPRISEDGRYVGFISRATNFASDGYPSKIRAFVHDRRTRETAVVSIGPNGRSVAARLIAISGSGRYIAFVAHPKGSMYVRDRARGRTVLASVGPAGEDLGVTNNPRALSISPDGRFVAFTSDHQEVHVNAHHGVYVRDVEAGITVLASVSPRGEPNNGDVDTPDISRGGRFVVFRSNSTNTTKEGPSPLPIGHSHPPDGRPLLYLRELWWRR